MTIHLWAIARQIAVLSFASVLAACAGGPTIANEPATGETIRFVVIGDTPYGPPDIEMLEEAIPAIRSGDFPFVIHVGDYKGGGKECVAAHDDGLAKLIADLAPLPVFYTPGDNEWTDCDRFKDDTGTQYSDLDRLDIVRTRFFATPPATPDDWAFARQNGQKENARWAYDGVQFMTLHVVGTNNGRDWVTGDPLARASAAADARDENNLAWLDQTFALAGTQKARAVVIAIQADMTDVKDKPEDVMCTDVSVNADHPCDAHTNLRAAIRHASLGFEGPVIIIHGDTAPFYVSQDFAGEGAPNLWRLNAAGDAGIGRTGFAYGVRDVTSVTIAPEAAMPIEAAGMVTGKVAKER